MLNGTEQDELTKLEKRVYRYVAYVALGIALYVAVLLKVRSLAPNVWINFGGFLMLMIGAVFGWGHNKNIRVLDLRKFTKS